MLKYQDPEAYYENYWQSSFFGSKEPNKDEQYRGNIILRFIEKYVVSSKGAEPGIKMLDLGCGRGWLTNVLARYGNVIGIDPVRAAIMRARELHPSLNFDIGTAENILLKGGACQFELIVTSEVIEHVVDDQKENMMRSVYSLLKAGGFAILTTPRGEVWNDWKRVYTKEQPVEQWITESNLEQLSRSVGFQVIDKDRIFIPWVSFNLMTRIATSRVFRRLMRYFPRSRMLSWLRYHCGLYQVIVLKRPL